MDDIHYGLGAHLNLVARASRKSKAERQLALEYFKRRETDRGYEGWVLSLIHDRKPAQRLLRQLAEVHIRSILSPGGFPAQPHTKLGPGKPRPMRLTGISSKTLQRDLEVFAPILTVDERRGRDRYVATLADPASLATNRHAAEEARRMRAALDQGDHDAVIEIQELRLLEPAVARSLVAFRDTAVSVFGQIVGPKRNPTQRERFLKAGLSWYTMLLVSLHAASTASVGLEYILGKLESRVTLVFQDANWQLSRDDAKESIELLATLWDVGTPFPAWLNQAGDKGLRLEQVAAATACWEGAFQRGMRTHPIEAAWGAISMGMVMRGLWHNTKEEFYTTRSDDWFFAAIKLSNGRDEGLCMLAGWCLNNSNPGECAKVLPDFAARLAALKDKPALLRRLMEQAD